MRKHLENLLSFVADLLELTPSFRLAPVELSETEVHSDLAYGRDYCWADEQ